MPTPMAVLGMQPMEETQERITDPNQWTWKPQVTDLGRLLDATRASSSTSRKTGSQQTDYGEGK